ncbi:MAG: FAS1-like dehydratase domain-containing protein [Trebonia sp.]
MGESSISAPMSAAVGRQLTRRVSFPVAESDIRRWAIAVYYPEPPPRQFWDAAYARSTRFGGIVAPEDFNPFAWMTAEREEPAADIADGSPDRTESMLGIPGPGLKYQLNGGLEVEYGARMRPGDVITSVHRLAGYSEREGRLGRMLFTVTEDSWTNAAGDLVKKTRMTLIRY